MIREENGLSPSKDQQQNKVGLTAKRDLNMVVTGCAVQTNYSKKMHCSHCGRIGHDKTTCWQIVGFPEWWSDHTSGPGRGGRGSARGGRGGSFVALVGVVGLTLIFQVVKTARSV